MKTENIDTKKWILKSSADELKDLHDMLVDFIHPKISTQMKTTYESHNVNELSDKTEELNRNYKILRNSKCYLFGLQQELDGTLQPKIVQQVEKLHEKIRDSIQSIMDNEDKEWDDEYKKLGKIQTENNLFSVWSISKIKSKNFSDKTPEIEEIVYSSWGPEQVHKFDKPTKITWLEFWKIADSLILKSQDTHHMFIEDLIPEKNKPGKFRLSTGS